jgi:Ser/Thr protein kinase RdoA (MazF antagonist)
VPRTRSSPSTTPADRRPRPSCTSTTDGRRSRPCAGCGRRFRASVVTWLPGRELGAAIRVERLLREDLARQPDRVAELLPVASVER